ncbi:MAG: glycyl-radical enzyme activating protein [Planctomycetota bacterium]|jgi:pyruvate formate lyase activating enzyme|nr:glycyl-radical enzyme activating protein [Planctomycetota bacterium]
MPAIWPEDGAVEAGGIVPSGMVFDIQRFSLHDGGGLRTTIFLKGCPLRCRWCSNPESQLPGNELFHFAGRCMGCGACVAACPRSLISAPGEDGGGVSIRRDGCVACGKCAGACPKAALAIKGRPMTADELVRTAARDRLFHTVSGGGVTLSGGEPFAQAVFVRELLVRFAREGIRTAAETSGLADWADIESCLPLLDEIFIDLKHTDPIRHAEWTGAGLDRIMPNAEKILRAHPRATLRIPVVPGFNTGEAAGAGFAGFAVRLGAGVELLPYHAFGEGKYRSLGRAYPGAGIDAGRSGTDADRLADFLRERGVRVAVSGRPAAKGG